MPPVDEISVHAKVRKTKHEAGCYEYRNSHRTIPCRQIGRQVTDGGWGALPECMGCQANKDHSYISKAREAITIDSRRFMKADQR